MQPLEPRPEELEYLRWREDLLRQLTTVFRFPPEMLTPSKRSVTDTLSPLR